MYIIYYHDIKVCNIYLNIIISFNSVENAQPKARIGLFPLVSDIGTYHELSYDSGARLSPPPGTSSEHLLSSLSVFGSWDLNGGVTGEGGVTGFHCRKALYLINILSLD